MSLPETLVPLVGNLPAWFEVPDRIRDRDAYQCSECLAICWPEDPTVLVCAACLREQEIAIERRQAWEEEIERTQVLEEQKDRYKMRRAQRRRLRNMDPDGPEGFYHRDRFGRARRSAGST